MLSWVHCFVLAAAQKHTQKQTRCGIVCTRLCNAAKFARSLLPPSSKSLLCIGHTHAHNTLHCLHIITSTKRSKYIWVALTHFSFAQTLLPSSSVQLNIINLRSLLCALFSTSCAMVCLWAAFRIDLVDNTPACWYSMGSFGTPAFAHSFFNYSLYLPVQFFLFPFFPFFLSRTFSYAHIFVACHAIVCLTQWINEWTLDEFKMHKQSVVWFSFFELRAFYLL